MPRVRNQRPRLFAALALLGLLLLGPGLNPNWQFAERLEQSLYDWRIRLTQQAQPDPRIVVVDIDEASLAKEGRWPWPRERLADLVERLLNDYQVAVVAFDMVFAESDRLINSKRLDQALRSANQHLPTPLTDLIASIDPDLKFAQSLTDSPVVLGWSFQGRDQALRSGALPAPLSVFTAHAQPNPSTATVAGAPGDAVPLSVGDRSALQRLSAGLPEAQGFTANLPLLQESAGHGGFFDNPLVDSDGVFRRVPLLQKLDGAYYPALSLATLQLLLGSERVGLIGDPDAGVLEQLDLDGLKIPVDHQSAALVPYRGPQGAFPYVSASLVLHGEAARDALEGTIVLIGTTAAGLLDLRATPVQSTYPGVEVHANLIAGMLDETLLHRPDYIRGANLLQCLVLGLLLVLVPLHLGALGTSALAAGLALSTLAINLFMWHQARHLLPLAAPMLIIIALYTYQLVTGYWGETRRHARISGLFGQYIPPELVAEMNREGQDYDMRPEDRELTVLFADIRQFTTLCEQLTAEQINQLLNAYLSPITRVIHQHRGTIDKYIGDAVMAFWGAPLSDAAHARHAVEGALAMLAAMEPINRDLDQRGLPRIAIGIGLNSGEMSVGNMGSDFRLAYTVLGDSVNLASRLEGLTKVYGVPLLAGEAVIAGYPEHLYRAVDRVRVKGKQQPVLIYQPLSGDPEQLSVWLALHTQALEAYWQQQWDQAASLFKQLQASPLGPAPYGLFLERIAQLRQTPPGADWDGVFTFDHK